MKSLACSGSVLRELSRDIEEASEDGETRYYIRITPLKLNVSTYLDETTRLSSCWFFSTVTDIISTHYGSNGYREVRKSV